jgi:hypothetical protein
MPHDRHAFSHLVAITAAAVCFAGCTMCPSPFDYAGPVPNGSATQNDFQARSNGIIPIGATPKPWPPLVQREADVNEPTVAAASPAESVPAAQPDINDGVVRVNWTPPSPEPDAAGE